MQRSVRFAGAASAQALEHDFSGVPLVEATPFWYFAWYKIIDGSLTHTLLGIYDSTVGNVYHETHVRPTTDARKLRTVGRNTSAQIASISAGYEVDEWTMFVGAHQGSALRTAWSKGDTVSDTANVTEITSINRLSMGEQGDSTRGSAMDGLLAVPTIWRGRPTDAAIQMLRRGWHPLDVLPHLLVEHWDFNSQYPYKGILQGTPLRPINGPIAFGPPAPVRAPRHWRSSRAVFGGTTFTLDAATGSVAITGTPANLEYNRSLDAAAGYNSYYWLCGIIRI